MEKFKCKNLLDYTLTYCKIDTILLAEIFQSFRTKMHNFSGLDPAHYISLPAFGYDSMLKITSSQIELPQDINIVHFLENAKRGGNCFIGTRNLKETTNSEIVYIDCNNLYGGAQMCKLPIGEYQWLTDRELKDFDITKEDLDGNIGYFVECDLRYPSSLHKKHSNFPLAPEFLQVEEKDLSPYQIHALQITQKSNTYKDCKLMCTYFDRQNYVLHGRNLKLYIELGLKLLKIHRVLKFRQESFIAPYIEETTRQRQLASTKFDIDLFKKLVNMCLLQALAYYLNMSLHVQ